MRLWEFLIAFFRCFFPKFNCDSITSPVIIKNYHRPLSRDFVHIMVGIEFVLIRIQIAMNQE